ncbi:MAG: OmpA family protein [Myxococcales bacterium]|nr:OmpA family protein [Myxococcales bacterium]
MKSTCVSGLVTGLALTLSAGTALAQNQGFALNRFDPSETGSDWFATETLDFRGDVRPAFGIVPEWGWKPLVIYDAESDDEISAVVQHQVYLHVGASLVFLERIRLGASFPMSVYTAGDGGTVDGVAYQTEEGFAPGDLRLGADVRIVGEFGGPASLAAGIQVHVPTGKRDAFAGDGKARIAPRLMLAGDADVFTYALKVGANVRLQDDQSFGGKAFGPELTWAAAAGVRLLDGALVLGPEVYGSTVVADFGEAATGDTLSAETTPLEIVIGGHYAHSSGMRFGLGAGPGLTRGFGTPVVRVVGSVEWFLPYEEEVPPPPDSDKDGIVDTDDACPTVPGERSDDPKKNGCPPPDSDKDGVLDRDDACPKVPGERSDDPKKNGCPPPPPDGDKDGVIDSADACPTVPGDKSDDPTKNGCPPDTDGDGIWDKDDACPKEPGPKSDDPTKHGCPLPVDTDGDGIFDPEDACPTVKGEPNTDPKKHGCPKAKITGKTIEIFERVEFDTARSTIRPESNPVLTAVYDIMSKHPEIELVSVEGHTDNVGPKVYNKNLSIARASAVVDWLVRKGINKKRLTSKGFGDEKPIQDNGTPEGRQDNRRVEFKIVKSGEIQGEIKEAP